MLSSPLFLAFLGNKQLTHLLPSKQVGRLALLIVALEKLSIESICIQIHGGKRYMALLSRIKHCKKFTGLYGIQNTSGTL